ncbi:MAG: hypothetical protein AB7V24_03000 [Steroidobacteraceae bacterium]
MRNAAVSRLGRHISEIIQALGRIDARFALIGGLALAGLLNERD